MTTPARTRPIAIESSWIILDGRCLIIRRTVRILRRATTTCFQTQRPGSQRSASKTTRNCRQAWMCGWSLKRKNSTTMELTSLCTVMISASIWTASMFKNSLRLWLLKVYNKKFFLFTWVCFLDSPRILANWVICFGLQNRRTSVDRRLNQILNGVIWNRPPSGPYASCIHHARTKALW